MKIKKGFTLLEIIITLTICSAIFAAFLPLVFNSVSKNRANRLKLNAYQAAQKELENMRGLSISSLNDHTFNIQGVPGAIGRIIVDKNINNEPQTTIAKVTGTVNWTFKNRNEQIELNTYIYGVE